VSEWWQRGGSACGHARVLEAPAVLLGLGEPLADGRRGLSGAERALARLDVLHSQERLDVPLLERVPVADRCALHQGRYGPADVAPRLMSNGLGGDARHAMHAQHVKHTELAKDGKAFVLRPPLLDALRRLGRRVRCQDALRPLAARLQNLGQTEQLAAHRTRTLERARTTKVRLECIEPAPAYPCDLTCMAGRTLRWFSRNSSMVMESSRRAMLIVAEAGPNCRGWGCTHAGRMP